MSLPTGWTRVPLGDLIDAIEAGKNLRCEERPPEPHERGIVKISAVTWGAFDPQEAKSVPEGIDLPPQTLVREGDFLMLRANTLELVGATVLVEQSPGNLHLSDKVLRIRTTPDIARWLNQYLRSIDGRKEIEKRATGNQLSMRNIGQDAIRQIEVPLPPLPEQRRIIAKLASLSERTKAARDELGRIPLLIEHYKKAILEKAFNGQLTADWREVRKLPSADDTNVGSLVNDIRYGTAQKCLLEASGVPVLRIPNVSQGRINLTDLKYAELPERELAKLSLREGDILIVRSNGSADLVGRPALVGAAEAGLAYAGYLIRLRPDRSAVEPEFLKIMLEAPQTRRVVETNARSTSGVHNINSTELAALRVPDPTLEEQREIVRRVRTAMEWLNIVASEQRQAAHLLDHLDQGLLAKAFRGALVPQDPNDEPAEKLVERIRAAREAEAPKRRGRRRKTAAEELSGRGVTIPRKSCVVHEDMLDEIMKTRR
jgi:type I restriction enzyme S subunit